MIPRTSIGPMASRHTNTEWNKKKKKKKRKKKRRDNDSEVGEDYIRYHRSYSSWIKMAAVLALFCTATVVQAEKNKHCKLFLSIFNIQ